MDKIIIIKNGDGSCHIINPAPEMFDPESRTRELLKSKGIKFSSDEEVLNFIINKDVPTGVPYRVVTKDKLPSDRTFRNAWTDDLPTDTVDVDIDKAREIHKDKLRQLRKPLLEKLDIDYIRADEQGLTELKTEIAAKKASLRDVTKHPDIAAASTPEELKAVIPSILVQDT